MMILFCIYLPVGALDDLGTCASVCLAETDFRYFDATTVSDKIPNVLCGFVELSAATTSYNQITTFLVVRRGVTWPSNRLPYTHTA